MWATAFAGGTSLEPRISLSNANVEATQTDPSDATAAYSLDNDGDVVESVNGTPNDLGDWMSPKVAALAANYEAMATLNSGTLTSGTTGSWLGLGTARSWSRSRTSPGTSAANLTIEIRRVGTSTTLASCTVVLTAVVEP